jgi:hypothetical protein
VVGRGWLTTMVVDDDFGGLVVLDEYCGGGGQPLQ